MKQITLFLALLVAPLFLFAQLQSIPGFGANPGNLDMYLYTPAGLEGNAPVVVAMHGCTQSASQFAQESGWNTLADTYGFYIIYPEQKSGNNSTRCFNWFEAADINRGQGEAQSVVSMVAYLKSNYNIDGERIFVTGFSAGGGMTSVMLATYPEVFAGGAIMSGLPYKAAVGLSAAFQAMNSGVNKTPQQWGELVRDQNPNYTGPWPRVAVFHGSSDFTVTSANVPEIVKQWTNIHNTDVSPDSVEEGYGGAAAVTRSSYSSAGGQAVVLTYEVSGMGHVVAIDPGTGTTQGGNAGSYTADVNVYSCYEAVVFWGLTEAEPPVELTAPSGLAASALSSSTIRISWMDNTNNEGNFILERSTLPNTGFGALASLPANTTAYTDQGLSPNTTYYYRVKAVAANSSSPYSNTGSATTDEVDNSLPPAAPSGLAASSLSSTQIRLSWTDNADNEASFQLERSESSNEDFFLIAALSGNTTSFQDESLSPGTTYYYRLRAANNAGNSAFSNEASATTEAESPITIIGQPQQQGWIAVLNLYDSGQSFTLPSGGRITQIDVMLYRSISGSRLLIYEGNTTTGIPIYEQTGISLEEGWQSIILDEAPNLQAGQYTFVLTKAIFGYTFTDTYDGGHLWHNGFAYLFFDAAFRVYLESGALTTQKTEALNSPSLSIFPNPTDDKLAVSFDEGAARARLINNLGQIMRQEMINGERVEWDVSELPAGIYYLHLLREEYSVSRAVIIE